MSVEKGRITVNEVDIIEVRSDPSVSPGVAAAIGSLAIEDADDIWQKWGLNDVDWAPVSRDIKSGVIPGGSFSGNPKKYAVSFSKPMPSTSYSIEIRGSDNRSWTYEAKTANGFTINANANAALAGEVSWTATENGETA